MRRAMSVFSPLFSYDPFADFSAMERRLNDRSMMPKLWQEEDGFTPTVATREGKYAYHLDVDLPGVNKDDIHLEITDHTLHISGERKHKEESEKEGIYRCESRYGRFSRSFTLPEGVDEENISSSCKDGVLEVVLPKIAYDEQSKNGEVH